MLTAQAKCDCVSKRELKRKTPPTLYDVRRCREKVISIVLMLKLPVEEGPVGNRERE